MIKCREEINLKTDVNNFADKTAPEIFAEQLKEYLLRHNGAIVAYSGGVDSALLAYIAHLSLVKGDIRAEGAWLMYSFNEHKTSPIERYPN